MREIDLSDNPNLRMPCALVVDDSHSMLKAHESGSQMIEILNSKLVELESDLHADDYLLARGLISVTGVSGDGGRVIHDWRDSSAFFVTPLTTSTGAVLSAGIRASLQMIAEITDELQSKGVSYVTPVLIVISSGNLDDPPPAWLSAIETCRKLEAEEKVRIYCVGVDSASCSRLMPLSVRAPKQLQGIRLSDCISSFSAKYFVQDLCRQAGEVSPLSELDPWRNIGI